MKEGAGKAGRRLAPAARCAKSCCTQMHNGKTTGPVEPGCISATLDRSNDGQDHTVLPYARPAMSPQYSLTPSTAPETYERDEA